MLVLSRKIGQTIRIGEDIIITVTDIQGDKVRIGVDAPKDIPVHRSEVYRAIKAEEQQQRNEHDINR